MKSRVGYFLDTALMIKNQLMSLYQMLESFSSSSITFWALGRDLMEGMKRARILVSLF